MGVKGGERGVGDASVTDDDDGEVISSLRRVFINHRADFQGPLGCRTRAEGQNHRVWDASVENDDEEGQGGTKRGLCS